MSSKSTIKAFHTLALDNLKVIVNYVPFIPCKYVAGWEAIIDPVEVFRKLALPNY